MAGPSGNETNHRIDGLTISGGLALEGAGGVLTYLNRDVSAYTARQIVKMRGQGYYAETFNRDGQTASGAGTSGVVYFALVGLLAGDVVSNMTVDCNTAGSVMTLVKLGLYDKTAANRLAVSAESSGSFASSGSKTIAMLTPYTVLADDVYFVAWLGVATTVPAISRSNGVNAGVGPSGVGVRAIQTAQTDLNASHTLTYNSGTAISPWVAIS